MTVHAKRGRSSMHDYARLLAVLTAKPGTTAQLSARFGMGITRLREVLTFMCARGLVFESAFIWGRGGWHTVWSRVGPSVPYPAERGPLAAAQAVRTDLGTFCRIVHELQRFASSPVELSEATGCSVNRVRPLLRYMRSLRLVFIAEWSRRLTPGGTPTAHYRWGRRPDAPRPARLSPVEAKARYSQVRKQRGDFARLLHITAGKPYRRSTTNHDERNQ